MNTILKKTARICWQEQFLILVNSLIYLILIALFWLSAQWAGLPALNEIIDLSTIDLNTLNDRLTYLQDLDPTPFYIFGGYALANTLLVSILLVLCAAGTLAVIKHRPADFAAKWRVFWREARQWFSPFLKILGITCGGFLLFAIIDGIIVLGLGWVLSILTAPLGLTIFMIFWSMLFIGNLFLYGLCFAIFLMVTIYALAQFTITAVPARAVCYRALSFIKSQLGEVIAVFFVGLALNIVPSIFLSLLSGGVQILLPAQLTTVIQAVGMSYISGIVTVFWLAAPYFHLQSELIND